MPEREYTSASTAGEPEAPTGPSVPAGEPEAPTGPTAPVTDPDGQPAPAREPGQQPGDPQPAGEPEAPTGPADASEDHERQLERDLEELTAGAEKADEYLELAKRTKADFENYRKRAARETAAAQERGIAKLARELLPAVDNLDRAVQAAESAAAAEAAPGNGAAETLVSGIKLVHADVLAALQRAGIERYSPQGEAFDPQHHEAIAQQPVEGAEPGTIVEVYQQGYRLGESVIRPARVVVAG